MKILVIDGDRSLGAFCNPVVNYRFKIITGSRCKGVVSQSTYKTPSLALDAGERMVKKMASVL